MSHTLIQFSATDPATDAAFIAMLTAEWNQWAGFAAHRANDPGYVTKDFSTDLWKRHQTMPLWWAHLDHVRLHLGMGGPTADAKYATMAGYEPAMLLEVVTVEDFTGYLPARGDHP